MVFQVMHLEHTSNWQNFNPNRSAIREAWAEFLSRYEWDVFATLTWRDTDKRGREVRLGPERIIRDVRQWLWRWGCETAIRRGAASLADPSVPIMEGGRVVGPWASAYRRGHNRPVIVVGIERGPDLGRLHAHCLIKFRGMMQDASRWMGWGLWWSMHGIARLEPPRGQASVAGYVSKYVTKGGDIWLSPTFKAARLPTVPQRPGHRVPQNGPTSDSAGLGERLGAGTA